MVDYLPRLIDRKLDVWLNTFGAVSIEGPKWSGKTMTCEQRAKSAVVGEVVVGLIADEDDVDDAVEHVDQEAGDDVRENEDAEYREPPGACVLEAELQVEEEADGHESTANKFRQEQNKGRNTVHDQHHEHILQEDVHRQLSALAPAFVVDL